MRQWLADVLEKLVLSRIPWVKGRGIGGYSKYGLFESKRYKLDCYLIYYQQGSSVHPHCDPAPHPYKDHEHHRVNITLIRPEAGGRFKFVGHGKKIVEFPKGRIVRFRPDDVRHWVTPVAKGYRLVLSFGWLTERKIAQHTSFR